MLGFPCRLELNTSGHVYLLWIAQDRTPHLRTALHEELVVVQSLSHVQLFVTSWTAACQASLTFTISQSLLKLLSIESVMPSNYLVLCCPLLLPSVFSQHQGLFQWVSSSHRWPKYWFNIYSLPEDLYVSFRLIEIICWIKSSKQPYYLIIICIL